MHKILQISGGEFRKTALKHQNILEFIHNLLLVSWNFRQINDQSDCFVKQF